MKRSLSVALVFLMMTALCCSAFAAEDTFVPSISYKEFPEIVEDEDGYIGEIINSNGDVLEYVLMECLILTPVSQAATSTQIPEDAKTLLLQIYEQLSNGTMKLPTEKLAENLEPDEVVIRELFDLSWKCEDHKEMVAATGNMLVMTFNINVAQADVVYAMTYKNGEWNPIVSVVNNGDGTVTCTFENLCPVAFVVGEDVDGPEPVEPGGSNVGVWVAAGGASAAGIGWLIFWLLRKRKKDKDEE